CARGRYPPWATRRPWLVSRTVLPLTAPGRPPRPHGLSPHRNGCFAASSTVWSLLGLLNHVSQGPESPSILADHALSRPYADARPAVGGWTESSSYDVKGLPVAEQLHATLHTNH